MAGRPPDPKRKNTNYMIQFPDQDFMNRLDNIAKREGISRKALLIRFVEEGFEKHDRGGNPQTQLECYAEGGKVTEAIMIGRVRTRLRMSADSNGIISYSRIVQAFKEEGVKDGRKRVALAKKTIEWLKGHDLKVLF